MKITLNGEITEVASGTVQSLLAARKLDTGKVAVELILAILPRSHYAETVLSEGDAIEIVRFIGGG